MSGKPWPDYIIQSFTIANRKAAEPTANESLYYGPYTRILYEILGLKGPFEVSQQFSDTRDAINLVLLVTVQMDEHPIFFIEVKLPGALNMGSKWAQADSQMRDRYRALKDGLITQSLPGVSAFGTRMAFYHYDRDTNRVEPPPILRDPEILNDVAPKDRWDADLLTQDGAERFRQVVERARDAALAALAAAPA
ncbi:hypothetical protein CC2G_001958 [Coprinopsis cinerea AmutBmut pab1-1]|nr:hypothetical protein CC2G_001958 [Coprinopsis cinerea AmutBmut pab1-1]